MDKDAFIQSLISNRLSHIFYPCIQQLLGTWEKQKSTKNSDITGLHRRPHRSHLRVTQEARPFQFAGDEGQVPLLQIGVGDREVEADA